MCLTFAFATASKQYPCPKDAQHLDTVHKAFNAIKEEQKPYLASTSSVDVPDEKKNISGTLGLLELAKWAQEQQFEWKGSPNVGINHDAYFLEAALDSLEAKRQRSL